MMNEETLWRELTALPPEAQRSVADFIAFLRSQYSSKRTYQKPQVTNLVDEPFVGLWRNRPEMDDSRVWVRNLREHEWAKSGG